MKLYDTLSKEIKEFKPINEDEVGLYACGPTVYDYTHIGHLRKYTMDDILIRTLKHEGYKVKFVQNVTDVGHLTSDGDTGEDKLEKGAKKYGKSVWDIAKEFEAHFFRSVDLMGNLRPSKSERATDCIQEQLEMVIDLEKKGFAYEIEGDGIYFDISKFPDYGKMASLNLEEQQEGARVDKVMGKRNKSDFALWKFEREGENREMVWESPWSKRSFPGWHIECSVMSMKHLGEQFDIHTGGIDHMPVHHTNEIAQSEAVTGKSPFVNYWVHHNFLKVDGTKMSKSLGNIYTIDDVIKRGFHPLALRLLFLTTHYQSEMNFTWENLAGAQKSYVKLLKTMVGSNKEGNYTEEQKQLSRKQTETLSNHFFKKLLGFNLNTPQALGNMWLLAKDERILPEDKKRTLLEYNKVLALGLERAEEILAEIESAPIPNDSGISEEIKELLSQRMEARNNNDWEKSDKLRGSLLAKGYRVLDLPDGQKLEKV